MISITTITVLENRPPWAPAVSAEALAMILPAFLLPFASTYGPA